MNIIRGLEVLEPIDYLRRTNMRLFENSTDLAVLRYYRCVCVSIRLADG